MCSERASVRAFPGEGRAGRAGRVCVQPRPLSPRSAGGPRKGYMGHLTRVANALAQNSEKGPNAEQLGQLLKGEGWGWPGGGRRLGARGLVSSHPPSPSRAARGPARAVGGVRVGAPGGDQQEEHRGPGEAPAPRRAHVGPRQCSSFWSSLDAPPHSPSSCASSLGAPQALTPALPHPRCPGEHPPPALLQRRRGRQAQGVQLPRGGSAAAGGGGGGAGRGGCSGRRALTAPCTLAGLHGLPDAAHDLSLHRPLWLQ